MSDTKVKIVDIQVNYKKAVESMAKYRSAIDDANNHIKELKKSLKDGKITQDEYSKQLESSKVFIKQQTDALGVLSRQVNNQIKVTKEQEGSLKQLRAELSNATAAYDAMSRAEREGAKGQELKQHILQITNELKGAEEQTLRFYRNVGNYPKEVSITMDSLGNKFKQLGNTVMGLVAGGSIMSFGQRIMQVGRDFNDGMARVRAVTQAGVEDMKMMSDEAKRLGASTAYTAAEAAGALENLTRNGLTAGEATNALSDTLRFAQANTIGLAESADIMTNVANGFNMGVEGMNEVSDSLSYTASHSATNVSQLAEALKNAAPFGYSLGQPIEEINASLGVLADVGIKGADAGTALRQVLMGLASPTKKQQQVFKEFGIEIDQQSLAADGLTETLRKLRDSGIMQSATSAEKLGDIFGRKVAPQAMALLNNVDSLTEKLGGLKQAQGTTTDMFNVSMSTVSNEIKSLQSAWEAFLLSIYDSNSEELVEPLTLLRDTVNWLREHLGDVGNIVMGAIAGITFTKLAASAMSTFTQIKTSAVTNAQAATNAVQVCQNEEVAIRRNVATLEKQIATASATDRQRIETMLVAKKAELAEAEKATQRAKTTEITQWERAAAMTTGNAWTQAMTVGKVAITGFVSSAKTAMKGFIVTAVIMLAYEAFQKLASMLDFSGAGFGKLTTKVTAFVRNGIRFVIDGLQSMCDWFVESYNNSYLFAGSIQSIKVAFEVVWVVVKSVFKAIFQQFKGLISIAGSAAGVLGNLFSGNWQGVLDSFKNVVNSIGNYLKGMVGVAVDAGKGIGDAIVNGINDAGKRIEPVKVPVKVKTEGTKKKVEDKVGEATMQDAVENESKKGTSKAHDKETERERNAKAKALQEETKLVAQAEKALLDLLAESAAKRRMQLEQQYNSEIAQLRTKLATEKNLTQAAKDAINQIIVAKEQKLQQELDKLSAEELKRSIEQRMKVNESSLKAATKGSEEQLSLKKQQLKDQLAVELVSLNQEQKVAEDGAALELKLRKDALESLQGSGNASQQAMTDAQNAVQRAQEQMVETSAQYATLRKNLIEQELRDEDSAQREHDDYINQQRLLAMQNQLTQLQQSSDEELTLKKNLNDLNLNIMTDNEYKVIEMKRQMAQQKLNDIMTAGQMEGETQADYDQRRLQAETEVSNAEAQLNQGKIKNQQAYANATKSITGSLISMLDSFGEENEAAAKASKVIALAQIAIDTGKALASGIASATSIGYPQNLVAIATTVATVLANVATAISTVKSAKFARGGKVEGPGTGTSDSIHAQLSNGEYVVNAKGTAMFEPVLEAINNIGRGVPIASNASYQRYADNEMMTASFTEAAQQIRPVVSVVEITETQNRVETIQNLDSF